MKLLLSFFFCLCSLLALGQVNLVPNASFEEYSPCPDGVYQVNKATGWDAYHDSPDYFNSCATSTSNVEVPKNLFGYQYPAAGNAYCGFITYNRVGPDREIIGNSLESPLVLSQKYYVSMMINRADSIWIGAGYASDKLGVKFFTQQPDTIIINNSAHFYSQTIITDTAGWARIFGSFIADSAYQYIMIGNFFDDNNTNIIDYGAGPYAYYFIDDVCVSTDSATCYLFTGVEEIFGNSEFRVYPNPASTSDNLRIIAPSSVRQFDLRLYDNMGILVLEDWNIQNSTNCNIPLTGLTTGIYYAVITSKRKIFSINLIISNSY